MRLSITYPIDLRSSTMTKRLIWLPAVALGLALAGQAAVYRAEEPTLTMTASWRHRPASVDEARDLAKAVVRAEVVSVQPDADLVVPAAGEPTGEDRIPTQRVQVRVTKTHKGPVQDGQTLQLFQVGGKLLPTTPPDGKQGARVEAKQLVLEGDPPYKAGEEYVLMLEDGPRGTMRPVAPEGRFRVEPGGAVAAMVDNAATKPVHGKGLAELERKLDKKA
jgi:hypothetical protein